MIDLEPFRQYFKYLSTSNMYKKLSETIDSQENKAQLNKIENRLTNLIEKLKYNRTSNAKQLKTKTTYYKLLEEFFTLIN